MENKLWRYGHTVFIYEGYMCTFGGNNESKLPSNQVWMLDLGNESFLFTVVELFDIKGHDQGRWVQCEIDGESPGR